MGDKSTKERYGDQVKSCTSYVGSEITYIELGEAVEFAEFAARFADLLGFPRTRIFNDWISVPENVDCPTGFVVLSIVESKSSLAALVSSCALHDDEASLHERRVYEIAPALAVALGTRVAICASEEDYGIGVLFLLEPDGAVRMGYDYSVFGMDGGLVVRDTWEELDAKISADAQAELEARKAPQG